LGWDSETTGNSTKLMKCYFKEGGAVKWWNPRDDLETTVAVLGTEPQYFARRAILDAGCGKGRFAVNFLKCGAQFVLALDISVDMLRITKWRLRGSRLINKNGEVVVGDIERLPLRDESFDATVCLETLIHLQNPQSALWELKRVTRAGGLLFVDVTSANPLRQLLDNRGLGNKVVRFFYHCVNIGIRLLFGERLFWRFYGTFPRRSVVPWRPFTREEFLRLIENAGLQVTRWINRGRYYAPSGYLAVARKPPQVEDD